MAQELETAILESLYRLSMHAQSSFTQVEANSLHVQHSDNAAEFAHIAGVVDEVRKELLITASSLKRFGETLRRSE